MNRDDYWGNPWLLTQQEDRVVVAWEVQEEGEDPIIWGTPCIARAFIAGRELNLTAPVYKDEYGSYRYEVFRRQKCQHCKGLKHAVQLTVGQGLAGTYYIRDGAGHLLIGLRNISRDAGIQEPSDCTMMDKNQAEVVKEVIRQGLAQPQFD
jgi:hypothetical protein